jgi:asparagine synthase (glutamine-hydrolysing)
MCGIAGMFGSGWREDQLRAMVSIQSHRGPDAQGLFVASSGNAGLGHNRLSIIDLSDAGRQPMSDASGRYWIVFNGEIYNYLEMRSELEGDHTFRTQSDTEVLLAAYIRWGEACLHRLIGMFAFAVWDEQQQRLFAARDRFGVKPFHYCHRPAGGLWIASEIKALLAAGASPDPDTVTWATYLASGSYDHTGRTFWRDVRQLPAGASLLWTPASGLREQTWYDPAVTALELGVDQRDESVVAEELWALLQDSVRLRFRADVPVGICLSGGLDSSLLLALVHSFQGAGSAVKTFTFCCGDPAYDETPWVERMLEGTRHPACFSLLTPEEVPDLAIQVAVAQDEPYGGLPTLGMAKVHQRAIDEGVVVLLDGNGLDEGWAGYDYYQRAGSVNLSEGPVQGSRDRSTRPECLDADFAGSAEAFAPRRPFGDPLRDLQYRDLRFMKIPRAMRFADRVSMMYSRELREPFLDHRLIELGLRQPRERKIRDGTGKWLLRDLALKVVPASVGAVPKRPVQTPQREWMRGPLKSWVCDHVEGSTFRSRGWINPGPATKALEAFFRGEGDNSFFVWQWLSLELWFRHCHGRQFLPGPVSGKESATLYVGSPASGAPRCQPGGDPISLVRHPGG